MDVSPPRKRAIRGWGLFFPIKNLNRLKTGCEPPDREDTIDRLSLDGYYYGKYGNRNYRWSGLRETAWLIIRINHWSVNFGAKAATDIIRQPNPKGTGELLYKIEFTRR